MDDDEMDLKDIKMARDEMIIGAQRFYDRYDVLFFGAILKPSRVAIECLPVPDFHLSPQTIIDVQTSLTNLKLEVWRWAEREYGISDDVSELIKSLERERELFQSCCAKKGDV